MMKVLWCLLINLTCFITPIFSQYNRVSFDTTGSNPDIVFAFPDTADNVFLRTLRIDYKLEKLIEGHTLNIDKVMAVLDWTHKRWKHNGSNTPSKSDALTILKEAQKGKKFRCVEYSIVLSRALQSLSYKARVLSVKTQNVETAKSDAGHVLSEVWLSDFNKWVMVDGQFNIMPFIGDIPLNAVELRLALQAGKEVTLRNINGIVTGKKREEYLSFIFEYLYYFDVPFDNGDGKRKYNVIDGKTSLFLVPIGAKHPTTFQRSYPITNAMYSHSILDFYPNKS